MIGETMIIGGLDEVGWGSLAGPLISVVATFRQKDLALLPPGVTDCKKLNESQRDSMYDAICFAAYDVGIGHAWPWEIDTLGPAESLHLSYRRAYNDLQAGCRPDLLIVDGKNRARGIDVKQQVEPKADLNHQQVSAASIIAKVFRDRIMVSYAHQRSFLGLPDYGWSRNKGYGSSEHTQAIKEHGLLINEKNHNEYHHRKRYCQKFLITPST